MKKSLEFCTFQRIILERGKEREKKKRGNISVTSKLLIKLMSRAGLEPATHWLKASLLFWLLAGYYSLSADNIALSANVALPALDMSGYEWLSLGTT